LPTTLKWCENIGLQDAKYIYLNERIAAKNTGGQQEIL
jgi:hypothetical protein